MRLIPRDNDLGWTPWAWLIYLVPFTLTPLMSARQANAAGWAFYIAATLVFLALYCRSYWVRGRELIIVASATVAMGVALWPVSHGAGAFFIYGAAMLGTLQSSKLAMRGIGVVALIAIGEALLLRRDPVTSSWPVIFVFIVGGINVHFSQVGRANARLRLARDEVEHLAKTAERERIARDLHDLLGHTLSVVILKSELASKLAERDPARARDEIRDVERISRDALAQVRAAVTGYRTGGFAGELQLAQSALATAGVRLESSIPELSLHPALEAVLSLAFREAVTNVVRHAGATVCRVAMQPNDDAWVMTVSDDGRGGSEPFGSGLTGMRERVEALGGTMTRDGRGGTTLEVRVPRRISALEERSA